MYSRSTLFLAAAIFAGSAASAGASDVYEGDLKGSIKDNAIETILVPEAVEIPETMSWYLRGDIGYGVSSSTDISTNTPGVFGPDDKEAYSFGFGRYLSPNLRTDFTFDYRNDDKIYQLSGNFTESIFRPGTVTIPNTLTADPNDTIDVQDIIRFDVNSTGSEVISFQDHTLLANLYYDIGQFGIFRPYVGGGVGVSIYEIETSRNTSFVDCAAYSTAGNAPGVYSQLANCNIDQSDIDRANEPRGDDTVALGFSASATVGASMDISDSTKLDMNYRYTYHAGDVVTAIGGVGDTLSVGSRQEHDLRVGVRYDIW